MRIRSPGLKPRLSLGTPQRRVASSWTFEGLSAHPFLGAVPFSNAGRLWRLNTSGLVINLHCKSSGVSVFYLSAESSGLTK